MLGGRATRRSHCHQPHQQIDLPITARKRREGICDIAAWQPWQERLNGIEPLARARPEHHMLAAMLVTEPQTQGASLWARTPAPCDGEILRQEDRFRERWAKWF